MAKLNRIGKWAMNSPQRALAQRLYSAPFLTLVQKAIERSAEESGMVALESTDSTYSGARKKGEDYVLESRVVRCWVKKQRGPNARANQRSFPSCLRPCVSSPSPLGHERLGQPERLGLFGVEPLVLGELRDPLAAGHHAALGREPAAGLERTIQTHLITAFRDGFGNGVSSRISASRPARSPFCPSVPSRACRAEPSRSRLPAGPQPCSCIPRV